jgi:hypothetical protein
MDFATRDARLRQADFDQVSPLAAPAGWRSRLWQSCPVTPVTFDVGAKWSNDLKEYAGTHSCQLPHVALVLSGTLRVVMDDGSQQDFSKNDVMLLPPGHDAWSVGNEAWVFVEFSRGNDYYTAEHGH